MEENTKNNSTSILTAVFAINAVIEIIAEIFNFQEIIYITKPLIPIIIMVLYYTTSKKQHYLFYLTISFSVITNLLFIPESEIFLFYAIITFTIHRLIMLYYVFKIVKLKDFKPLVFIISTIPLLLIFVYLLVESSYLPKNSIIILIFQILLIGVFGGVAISKYIINDSRQNTYLMICAVLFTALQFIVFIEKYFLHDVTIITLRPIAMCLNVLAFYSFYKFVITSEENHSLDNN